MKSPQKASMSLNRSSAATWESLKADSLPCFLMELKAKQLA